jgi:hypothetical protein
VAKFLCICGASLSTSGPIPHPYEWELISDVEFDGLRGEVDDIEALYLRMRSMLRCPVSGHLWVFWDGFDSAPTVYEPLPGGGPSTAVNETDG